MDFVVNRLHYKKQQNKTIHTALALHSSSIVQAVAMCCIISWNGL